MKLTTGYKKPIASSGTDAQEQSSNNSYLLLAGGGHKALSELVSPADLTTELSNYVTIGSNQTITGGKTFSQAINTDITGNASTATNVAWSGVTNKPNFVNSFGNKTGDITIRGGQTDNGSVNLTMSNNELQASIVGLGSNAYTSTEYLPLSGGTISNTNTQTPLTINASGMGNFCGIQYINNYNVLGYLGFAGINTPAFRKVGVSDTSWNILYHSGNLTASVIGNLGTLSNDITGNAATAGNANTLDGNPASAFAAVSHYHTYLPYKDTRATDYAPYSSSFADRGLSATHLKYNSTDGLLDGGAYHSSIYIYPWSDSSGGCAHNLAFTDNGNIWLRSGTSSWGGWKKVAWASDIPTSLPANGGNADYATAAGNAGTLSGHTSDDFVLKTTHDVYESIIAEALNDLDSRKVDIADIPTSLPANGGNADTVGNFPASAFATADHIHNDYVTALGTNDIYITWTKNGSTSNITVPYAEKAGDAGSLGGWHKSAFATANHTHTTSEITNFPTIGNGALHIKVNGTELTPEGGIFTANKGGDSTINITVPTAESIEQSTLNKLGDKVVLKNSFTTELAKEMAEVLSGKNPDKGLVFNFTNPASPDKIECNPDILSVNYIKVGEYYRLNIAGSFVLNGFNFYEQKIQDNYNPVLYSVISGTINNVELSAKKTGMLCFRLSDQQVSPNGAYGPVMFELSVFVESLSTDYNEGIYGELNITQFYS